ncbi:hypothetical protein [Bradyrhizobium sp. SZCCHNR1045]|uniref:hypothetical protein n=1 Tax=Bradyrhizobium sp. SZCCHNR1045 TaxID=3057353 RepID=UPI002915CE93|nr:hypothetical protein [Bradyrhizobium sp. SZCCHNR1045]
MSSNPPPDVQAAAAKVQTWLDSQQRALTPAEIAKLSSAEKLDYTRARSTAVKMPDWRNPRAAG